MIKNAWLSIKTMFLPSCVFCSHVFHPCGFGPTFFQLHLIQSRIFSSGGLWRRFIHSFDGRSLRFATIFLSTSASIMSKKDPSEFQKKTQMPAKSRCGSLDNRSVWVILKCLQELHVIEWWLSSVSSFMPKPDVDQAYEESQFLHIVFLFGSESKLMLEHENLQTVNGFCHPLSFTCKCCLLHANDEHWKNWDFEPSWATSKHDPICSKFSLHLTYVLWNRFKLVEAGYD